MSHAHSKIWIHSVWGTKHRTSIILPRFEDDIFDFMHKQFMLINCKASIINGMPDHIHCLFRLSRSKSISQVMKQVKGSTSRFINDQCHIKDNFEWQVGYGAFSVSESVFPTTYNYIAFQKQHHKKITFPEEYDQLTNQNGLIISSF